MISKIDCFRVVGVGTEEDGRNKEEVLEIDGFSFDLLLQIHIQKTQCIPSNKVFGKRDMAANGLSLCQYISGTEGEDENSFLPARKRKTIMKINKWDLI